MTQVTICKNLQQGLGCGQWQSCLPSNPDNQFVVTVGTPPQVNPSIVPSCQKGNTLYWANIQGLASCDGHTQYIMACVPPDVSTKGPNAINQYMQNVWRSATPNPTCPASSDPGLGCTYTTTVPDSIGVSSLYYLK